MASGLARPTDLEHGEQLLGVWAGEPVRPDGSVERPGWLVLTDRRVLFYRKSGLWGGGRLETPPKFGRRLEEIRSVEPQRFWMKIGYGDRVEMPGISVDELRTRLNRNASSQLLVGEITEARKARRVALGLPSL